MAIKASMGATLFLLLLLVVVVPAFSRGNLHVKHMNSEVYEIDYRGPETHTHIPPPNRAGGRPKIHHQANLAGRKNKRKVKKN